MVAVQIRLGVAIVYKVRICFEKQGYSKYISNLDLMRLFQRVFKIAKVDIAYSQGFNPHQKISISNPLPIGISGSEEYMDIQVNSVPDYRNIVKSLNGVLPDGIKVLWASEPKEDLNLIKFADYSVEFGVVNKLDNFTEYVNALKEKDDIVVSKKSKKGIINVDIKPHIFSFEIIEGDGYVFKLHMLLETSDKFNLKPTAVIDAFKKYIPGFVIDYYIINRNALLKENMSKIDR